VGNLNTPALLFGIILLVASIGLFLFGRVKPELQRDADSVYAIIGVVCSLILFASAFELSLGMSFQQLLMIGTLIALMWENIQGRQPKSLAPKRSGGSFDDGRRGGYRDMDDYGRPEPSRDRPNPRRGGYGAEVDDYGRPSPDPRRLREAPLDEDEGRRRPRRDEADRPRRPALEDRESRDQRRGSSDWGDEWGPEPARKPARADAWTEPDRPARPADRPDRSDRPDRPLDRSLDRVFDSLDGRPADRPVDRPSVGGASRDENRPERSRGSLGATDDLPRRRRPAVDMAPDRPERPAPDRANSDRANSERPIADRTGPSDGDDIAAEFSVRPRRPRVEDRPADRPTDRPSEDLPRRRRPPITRPDGDDEAPPMPYVDFKPLKPDPDEADNSSNFDD
jgi:Ycf66 protein N-terminus